MLLRSQLRILAAALLMCAAVSAPVLMHGQKPYKVIDRWKVGGDGGWDDITIDNAAHRLYISRGARVDVVDTQTGKLAGSINGLHRTHAIGLEPSGKLGFITDGGGNAVVVFDRATLATVATIPAGTNPDLVLYEPVTQSIWAFNGRSRDATIIDVATLKAVATLAVPGKPEFSVTDGKGTIYTNIEDKGEIIRIDARQRAITATWPMKGCDSPSGLGFDAAGARLFSVCDGKKMFITDAVSGGNLGVAAIGDGPDGAGFSLRFNLAFSSNGEGTLSVIDASKPGFPTVETLPTQKSARTMTYDKLSDRIYTVAAEFGPRPAPTAENPRPAAPLVPGSFVVLVIGRE
jgi:YVTN family beta-propeller protein